MKFQQVFCQCLIVLGVIISGAPALYADVVMRDEGVEITAEEMKAIIETLPDSMLKRVANDRGERFELISQLLTSRKLAHQADSVTKEDEDYWDLYFKVIAVKEKHAYQKEFGAYEVPPLEDLAQERYVTEKDKYAKVAETRSSSHILFRCPPGCDRKPIREKAAEVLRELENGESFEDAVAEYSEDPGTKRRSGSLDRWLKFGDTNITPPYTEALFEISEVGGYSDVVDSQFGLHIIRLDGIKEAGYLPYEEVANAIKTDLVKEFRKLAAAEVRSKYSVTEDAYIDGDALEDLLAPHK